MTDADIQRRLDRIEAQLDSATKLLSETNANLAALNARLGRVEELEARADKHAQLLAAHGVWIKILSAGILGALGSAVTALAKLLSGDH